MSYVKESAELLPCPFCKKEADLCKVKDEEAWLVKCWNRGCLIMPRTREYDSKVSAVAAWNMRG